MTYSSFMATLSKKSINMRGETISSSWKDKLSTKAYGLAGGRGTRLLSGVEGEPLTGREGLGNHRSDLAV